MAKVPFSDVTPPEKRSIRNIPIPNSGRRKPPVIITPNKEAPIKKTSIPRIEEQEIKQNESYQYYYPQKNQPLANKTDKFDVPKKSRSKKFLITAIIFVVCAIFVVSMMTIFASADIEVTPKNQDIAVSMDIKAANGVNATNDTVKYEVVKLSKTESASLPATGKENVEIKSRGKIIIYNNFSTEPQRLIVRTRFETNDGLIYRIPESVVVPGKTVKDGIETPGSIEVEVFADEAGEKYNIKKTDFTVPGFKNDPERYKNFYARSSTDITGGFVGERNTVTDSEKRAAVENLDNQLKADLERELGSKVPEGLVLLSGATYYVPSEPNQDESSSSVVLEKEGTAYAIMLDKKDLSKVITEEYASSSPEWSSIPASVLNFSNLSITKKPDEIASTETINLSMEGKAKIWADIDPSEISERVKGMPRKQTPAIIDEFAGISSLKVTIRPIWKQSFPGNPLKIHIKTLTTE